VTALGDYGTCESCEDGAVFDTWAEGCPMCSRPAPDDRDEESFLDAQVFDAGGGAP
jgi:hypothetical protein